MVCAHVALDFVFWCKRCNRVDDDNIDFARAHERLNNLKRLLACVGLETSNSSSLTPIFFAYSGSSACSASINAQMPPFFCASAIACKQSVVLPEDSGPKISKMRPRGYPPMPSAQSRPMEPEGIASTSTFAVSPSFIIASSPNLVLMSRIAASIADCISYLAFPPVGWIRLWRIFLLFLSY